MRLKTLLISGLALGLLATAGPGALGQSDNFRDVTIWRPNFITGRMEPSGGGAAGPSRIIRVQPRERVRPRMVVQPRRVAPAPVVVGDAPAVPVVEPTTFVAVIGDSLAELTAQGLEDAFLDTPSVKVLRRTKSDSGLVRTDYHDWAKAAREMLASEQKVTMAVMLVGANDRQAIREGEVSHEPFSDRWREIYRQRIDEIAAIFAEKKVPLIWAGAPPMQNRKLSADMVSLNEMIRARVERGGGTYVDLWEGFVDAENRFAASGPDYSGQPARLRAADGVHFTKAGARKAGHYVHVAARRLIETGAVPAPVIALPNTEPGTPVAVAVPAAAPVDQVIDRMVGSAPAQAFVPQIAVKPLAGPVVPLTGPAPSASGELLTSAARARGGQASDLDRLFGEGQLPPSRAGRADDFTWKR